MLTRVVKMQFETEFIAEFSVLFKNVNQKIRNFEGCKDVKLLQHESDLTIFFTISLWENADALENYRKSALFKDTWVKVKPHFTVKAEAWSLLEQ